MNNYLFVLDKAALPIFCGVAVVHLVFCWLEKKRAADVTKVLLMPLLLAAFVIHTRFNSLPFSSRVIFIVIALFFSFWGDWALINGSEQKFFVLGLLSFAVAQICYILFGMRQWYTMKFPTILGLIVATFYVSGLVTELMIMKEKLQSLAAVTIIYGLLLSIMSWSFVTLAVTAPTWYTIVPATGSLLFLLSDSMVAYEYFIGKIVKGRFLIMVTYSAAQLMIVLGAAEMLLTA